MNTLLKNTIAVSILTFSLFSTISTFPIQTLAASDGINSTYTLLEPLPCINGNTASSTTPGCVDGKISNFEVDYYITYAFRFAIAFAAFAAVCVFTYGGFEYMVSESSLTNKKAAKDRMQNSVLGLLAVLGSYVILNTIDPRLVNVSTKIEPLRLRNSAPALDFSDLIADLGQQAQDVRQRIANGAASTTEINNRINELYSELDSATSTEESERIQLEVERLEEQKKAIAAQSAVDFAEAAINLRMNRQSGSIAEIDEHTTAINKYYNDAAKTLTDSGRPDLIPRIAIKRDYAGIVLLNKRDALSFRNDISNISTQDEFYGAQENARRLRAINELRTIWINKVKARMEPRIAGTSDPVMKSLYQQNLDATIANLNSIR